MLSLRLRTIHNLVLSVLTLGLAGLLAVSSSTRLHSLWFQYTEHTKIAFAGFEERLFPPQADEIHFTLIGTDAVVFDWRGTADTLHYGTQSHAYTHAEKANPPHFKPVSSSGPFREVRLSGLESGRRYFYAIGNGPEHTFETSLDSTASDFSIAVEADVGQTEQSPNVAPVQDLVHRLGPSLVLVVGDLTYANQTDQRAVDQHFNDVMVWSEDIPYMPAWGNHEGRRPDDFVNYAGRFVLPNAHVSSGSKFVGGEDWYWFDYGETRFIAYPEPQGNSWEEWKAIMHDPGGPMAQAQADPHIRFIVTFGHRPAFSTGTHKGSGHLKRILTGLGDTYPKYVLSLNGHSHDYERTSPQHGVVFMTVGTGGKELEQSKESGCLWTVCQVPDWSAKRYMRDGVLKLSFTHDEIRGAFVCGPAGGGQNDIRCSPGDTIDSFSIGPRG